MRTPFRLTLSALILALIAGACGNDDTPPTTAPDDATTTTTMVAVSTTAAAVTPQATTGRDDLAALRQLYERTPLRTTYTFSEGGEQTLVTLSQDPAQDPPVQAVIIPDADAKLITIGTDTIFCDTHSNQCFEVPGGTGDGFSEGLLGPFAGNLFFTSHLDAIPSTDLTGEPEEIAGRTGMCFTFTPPPSSGLDTESIRQCVDAELGFTLLIQSQAAGATEADTVMELVEFGEPHDDDFTPTGPVTESP